MRNRLLRAGLSLAASLLSVALSTQANATIYNIAATASARVDVTIVPGTYLIRWVGIADGGLYDAAGGVSMCMGCADGFSNAIVDFTPGFNLTTFTGTLDFLTTRTGYSTAADSLAAYEAGTSTFSDNTVFLNGVAQSSGTDGLIPNPFITVALAGGTHTLAVFDADMNPANNTGGISLSIERIGGAVPEPATWAMMLVGFGAIGFAMRRQRQQARVRVAYS